LQGSALVAGSAIASQFIAETALAEEAKLAPGATILFQGDSITDAGRDRQRDGANVARAFGDGYPLLIAAKLLADRPALGLKCFNRGISGNKVPDLDKRWQEDCIDLEPSILSILIGVNDIWHKLSGRYEGTVQTYETGLTELLQRTQDALPKTRIVICEPFVLRCGAVNDSWFPEFDDRRAACKRVAEAMQLTWVPFQTMFDAATSDDVPPAYWASDGVHPSMAGHALMAKTWLETVF
jgi:lysophospholipase L1-like esterase